MDFELSEEQTLLRQTVRSYCQANYRFNDRQAILHGAEGFSRQHWKAYAELGWLGAAMPKELGGIGGSVIDNVVILEEFGRHLVLEPFISCVMLAAPAVYSAACGEQRERLLPRVIGGELLLALAHGEQEARGDLQFVETRADRRTNGRYVITGRKSWVPGGSSADMLIVSARTSGEVRDRSGISLFLLPSDATGLTRRSYRTVDGGHAADLELCDVEVDSEALIGNDGEALPAIVDAVNQAIVGVCAEAVGAMDSVVTITRDYLKTRRAYGTTLSTFQALQHRLADMLVELELSRSILYRALAAGASDDRSVRRRAVSAAKALIGRSGRFVGAYGIQLHGGMGFSDEYIIGHLFKRLTVIEKLFGNSDFHLGQTVLEDGRAQDRLAGESLERDVEHSGAALSEAAAT